MPKILLHICCGPCSIMPIKYFLDRGFTVYGYFINPNIQPLAEYIKRREGAQECALKLGIEILFEDSAWNLENWLNKQLPVSKNTSKCFWCCNSRLKMTFLKAAQLEMDYFSTTLLYSKYQPHDKIAEFGKSLSSTQGPVFHYRDFRNDWQEGIEISKQWGIYRQQYCGCIFSEKERYAKKFSRLKN